MKIKPIYSKDSCTYWVDAEDKLYIQRLQNGQYQRSNWLFSQTLLQSYRNAIDIGSNNGCNAIHYADKFRHVYCFEPTEITQQLWHNTIRDNNVRNATLYTTALADKQYKTDIVLFKHNLGHNHLDNQYFWHPDRKRRRTRQLQPVECRTLDSYGFEDIDFIKIDVEGFEQYVIKGAETTIKHNRPLIQLEIVESQCKKFKYTPNELIDLMRSWDYALISKSRGCIEGTYKHKRGEMDIWFQPIERSKIL